jgi:hypothetical protein
MKAETDIIASLTTSPKGRVLILVMMYIETVKADVNIFEGDLFDRCSFKAGAVVAGIVW